MLAPLGLPGPNIFAGLRPLHANERMLDRSLERIATGRMINRASDDPAGLIAGLRFDAALRALDAESRAIRRETDRLAAKDGALAASADLVGELRGLAVRAADSTLSDAERQALETQAASIVRAVEHTGDTAEFAGRALFDEPLASRLGATETDAGEATLADVGRGLSLDRDAALIADIADQAAEDIALMRGEIGATIAIDLAPRSRALDEESIRLAQARSLITDTDYAREVSSLMRADALAQASRFVIALDARNTGLALDLLGGR